MFWCGKCQKRESSLSRRLVMMMSRSFGNAREPISLWRVTEGESKGGKGKERRRKREGRGERERQTERE